MSWMVENLGDWMPYLRENRVVKYVVTGLLAVGVVAYLACSRYSCESKSPGFKDENVNVAVASVEYSPLERRLF